MKVGKCTNCGHPMGISECSAMCRNCGLSYG